MVILIKRLEPAGEDIDKKEENSWFGQEVCLSVYHCLCVPLGMACDSLEGGLTR